MAKPSPSELEASLQEAKRRVILDHALANPDLTLGELLELEGDLGSLARSLKVKDLASGSVGGPRRGRPPGRRGPGRPPGTTARAAQGAPRVRGGEVDTRSKSGRERYDQAVITTVRSHGGPISAQEIRTAVGGTPLQVRTALNRLIEAGLVTYSGKARATRYMAR